MPRIQDSTLQALMDKDVINNLMFYTLARHCDLTSYIHLHPFFSLESCPKRASCSHGTMEPCLLLIQLWGHVYHGCDRVDVEAGLRVWQHSATIHRVFPSQCDMSHVKGLFPTLHSVGKRSGERFNPF